MTTTIGGNSRDTQLLKPFNLRQPACQHRGRLITTKHVGRYPDYTSNSNRAESGILNWGHTMLYADIYFWLGFCFVVTLCSPLSHEAIRWVSKQDTSVHHTKRHIYREKRQISHLRPICLTLSFKRAPGLRNKTLTMATVFVHALT